MIAQGSRRDRVIALLVLPRTARHVAVLAGFSSVKKASEFLHRLVQEGLARRTPVLGRSGRPEFLYYTGVRPHPRTIAHTLLIGSFLAGITAWLRRTDIAIECFTDIVVSAGFRPDATIVLRRGEKALLVFVEIETGATPLRRSSGYSLESKISSYAHYLDTGVSDVEFSWAGPVQGFRVALMVAHNSWRRVQQMLAARGHDFCFLTTFERLQEGFDRAVWLRADGVSVDFLGRVNGPQGTE